jgi:Sulfotransferase domain
MHYDKRHILVTGSHRSGTTWVGRTISQHPKVRYVHEPFNVSRPNHSMSLRLDTWFTHYQSSNRKNDIKASFDILLQSSSLQNALHVCRRAGLDVKTPLRFGKHLILWTLFRPRVLIKDPIALLSAGWLHETYNLKVICMIRNPLAFVGSLKVAGWDFDFQHMQKQKELIQTLLIPFNDEIDKLCSYRGKFIDRACLLWNLLHLAILEYQKQYPSWLFVRHEDLADDPELGFLRIFDYLKLNMNRNIQEYIEEFASEQNSTEAKASIYQPRNSKESLGTWKNRLSPDEIARVRIATKNIGAQFYEDMVY